MYWTINIPTDLLSSTSYDIVLNYIILYLSIILWLIYYTFNGLKNVIKSNVLNWYSDYRINSRSFMQSVKSYNNQ